MLKINIILKENKIKLFNNNNNKNTCSKIFRKSITKGNSTTLVFLILFVAYTGLIRSVKKLFDFNNFSLFNVFFNLLVL